MFEPVLMCLLYVDNLDGVHCIVCIHHCSALCCRADNVKMSILLLNTVPGTPSHSGSISGPVKFMYTSMAALVHSIKMSFEMV